MKPEKNTTNSKEEIQAENQAEDNLIEENLDENRLVEEKKNLDEVCSEKEKQTKKNLSKEKPKEESDEKPTVKKKKNKQLKEDEADDEESGDSLKKEILSWAFTIVFALFLGWFLSRVVLYNANVPTPSMETTIMKGDNLIGFRLAYKFSEPKRGDIVIFPYPDDTKINYVKRIIGMPGDTVEVHDGSVYINGEILDESEYLTVTTEGECGPFVVPEGSYFMMGDNRNCSLDSRYWENKYVKEEDIIAKVIFRYYPSIGRID